MDEIRSPFKNMPSCWQDDKRMAALYAPFRKRELNPVDYDSKLKFWQNAVLNLCLEKNICTISIRKVQEEFRKEGKLPLCMNIVFEELLKKEEIINKEDFVSINPEQTWTGWVVSSLIKTPMLWSFSKLKEALIEIDSNDVEYVNMAYLKYKGDELVNFVENRNKFLYSLEEVRSLLHNKDIDIANDSMNLILHWLQINKKAFIKTVDDITVIKFIKSKSEPISEQDMSWFILESNKINLKKAIETLEKEKGETEKSARDYVKKGMKEMAKTYLRRKKELEKTIAKRVTACENLEILSSRINDASSDSKVLESYKTALSALKSTWKENGLNEDVVHETISEMEEVNEMHEEIQTALSEPISHASDIELEEELMEILAIGHQPDDNGPSLPNVPYTKLSSNEELKTPEEPKRIMELSP